MATYREREALLQRIANLEQAESRLRTEYELESDRRLRKQLRHQLEQNAATRKALSEMASEKDSPSQSGSSGFGMFLIGMFVVELLFLFFAICHCVYG